MTASPAQALLAAEPIAYRYGAIEALADVSIAVRPSEAVCIIGPNGAGKTTLARVVGGLYTPSRGQVLVDGVATSGRAQTMVRLGVASVLEGRRLFVEQSVRTNLELGAYASRIGRGEREKLLDGVLELFPPLVPRLSQRAATMSGGEQQMVAIARALMSNPRVLILDEPSMGLSPKITSSVFAALHRLRDRGLGLVLIEQNAALAFKIADRGYLMRQGRVVASGPTHELAKNESVRAVYLGP